MLVFAPIKLALNCNGALDLSKTKTRYISNLGCLSVRKSNQHALDAHERCSNVCGHFCFRNKISCNVTEFAIGLLFCIFFILTCISSLLVRVLVLSCLRIQLKTNLMLLSIQASCFNFQLLNQAMIVLYRINLTLFVASAVLLALVMR